MNVSQQFSDHGELAPTREVQVNRQLGMERTILYMKLGVFADGCRLYAKRPYGEPPFIMIVAPMEEPPVYLVIGDQEAEMIADAIRPRPQVNERHLDDAIQVRDRLLSMAERHSEYWTRP
jgi:hypothetical protein